MTETQPTTTRSTTTQPTTALPWFSAEDIAAAVSPRRARQLVERALLSGFDPAGDPARTNVSAGEGHLLLMPSVIGEWTGTKVASVAPGNPAQGLPRIQAVYVLMDTPTLTPRALLQGDGLTALRTPEVSAVAADRLTVADARKLVVFGTGPQALAHIEACADIREFQDVVINGRQESGLRTAVEFARGLGLTVRGGSAEEVRDADLVVCATSSGTPLFDGRSVPDSACVVAMGSHEPERRELDTALMARAQVVVEDTATALREAGDVIMAAADLQAPGQNREQAIELVDLVDLVNGGMAPDRTRPRVFKGVGMSWQDLAVAGGVVEAAATD